MYIVKRRFVVTFLANFRGPDEMRVVIVVTPQAKPDLRTIPVLERPVTSAAVPFDRMIHRGQGNSLGNAVL